jgi:hypothetical protein
MRKKGRRIAEGWICAGYQTRARPQWSLEIGDPIKIDV